MNEEQRLSYLRSMGYQVYYLRAILPDDRPLLRHDLPESSSVEMEKVSKATATIAVGKRQKTDQKTGFEPPQSKQPRKSIQESTGVKKESVSGVDAGAGLRKIKEESMRGKSEGSTDSSPAGSEIPAHADSLKFRLQYYAIGDQLAIINEEPFEILGKQGRESLVLLKAILHALKPGFDSPLKSESFDWPIAEGLSAAEPERAARLALQGFINQRQSQERFSNLLVFTAQLGRLFNENSPDEPFGDVKGSAINCQLTLTHSLHSILACPLLKREVWAHLQPLLNRLQVQ